MDGTI